MKYLYLLIIVLLTGCNTKPQANPFRLPFNDTPARTNKYGMGLIKSERTLRLKTAGVTTPKDWTRPPWINNAGYFMPITDQGQTPTCTAYALEYLVKGSYWRHTGQWPDQNLHTKIYMAANRLDGDNKDGASLESAMSVLTNLDLGLGKITIQVIPVWDPDDVPYAIHRYGAVFSAMEITDQWERYHSGLLPHSRNYIGPHAQIIVGYDDQRNTMFGVNSWGQLWGRQGFWEMSASTFTVEYAYGYAIRITFDPMLGTMVQ